MNIADGVEMLEISGVFLGQPCKAYPVLINDGDTTLLVDTGFPGYHTQIREAMEEAGIPYENLNRVILTHQDIDHIGGLSAILQDLPDQVEVLAHESEKAYIQGDRRPHKVEQLEKDLDSKAEEVRAIYEYLKLAYQDNHIRVDSTLTDGQELPYLGGIVVIHTPGHTLGHICLYLKKSKILIPGDVLVVEKGNLVPCPNSLTYDESLGKQSLKKLSTYDIRTVICYHGGLYDEKPENRIKSLALEQD